MRPSTAKRRGAIPRWREAPGGERTRRMNVDVPEALASRIRAIAFRDDCSLSDALRTCVAAGLPAVEGALAKAREGGA